MIAKHSEKSIHNRDSIIDERGRFGDFEGDTIYGSVGKGYLVTAIDRKSRFLVAATCKDKSISSINSMIRSVGLVLLNLALGIPDSFADPIDVCSNTFFLSSKSLFDIQLIDFLNLFL